MSIPSPSTTVARLSPDPGGCEGCQRTMDETTRWSRSPDDDRRGILAAVAERREWLGEAAPSAETRA